MNPALVLRQGMDLVDDDPAYPAEVIGEAFRGQGDGEGFRSGDQDMRRIEQHPPLPPRRGVASPHFHANSHLIPGKLGQLAQRRIQVPFNVIPQGFERRDIEGVDPILQLPPLRQADQLANDGEEGCQRLPRAGGRGDQAVFPLMNQGNGELLRWAEFPKSALEPPPHQRMEHPQDLLIVKGLTLEGDHRYRIVASRGEWFKRDTVSGLSLAS